MKLIVLVGPPGSGKSTYCNEELDNEEYLVYPHLVQRISQDDQGKNHLNIFKEALLQGKDIFIDRMNFDKNQRNRYIEPARKSGYTIEIVVFHVPRQTCFERIMARENHPTVNDSVENDKLPARTKEEKANSALDTFFTKYERVEDTEADKVTRLGWVDDSAPKAIWCDLDNTLCDTTHRNHFMDRSKGKPNWKGFFDAMGEDVCNVWCKDILEKMNEWYDVVLCSGRPDSHKNITQSWLLHNNIPYNHLFMRHRSDFRKDDIVKLQFYEFEVKTKYNLLFAIDDRDQVVKILRENGVIVLQCNYGDF